MRGGRSIRQIDSELPAEVAEQGVLRVRAVVPVVPDHDPAEVMAFDELDPEIARCFAVRPEAVLRCR